MSSDPTLKALVETAPADWLALLGQPRRRVTIEDADIAVVTSGAADKVLRVHADPQYLVHLEFQSGHDTAALPRRLKLYNGVLEFRHDCTVLSAAILLHPGADSPQVNGLVERRLPGQEAVSYLRYQVVRVWQLPVEQLLSGGLGTLPLAPISAVSSARLPEVIRRMQERLRSRQERWVREVWGATFVLMGLRYSQEVARRLFSEVLHMKESVTYQAIIEEGRAEGRVEGQAEGRAEGRVEGQAEGRAEGRAEEARRLLLRLGQKQLGRPDEASRSAIQALTDVDRLEQLVVSLPEAASWQQLLTPTKTRQSHGRKKR